MQLTEHKPGDHYFIRRVSAEGIQINDTVHATSLIVGARHLDTDWPVTSLNELSQDTIAPIVELEPELVIIGYGRTQKFPEREVMLEFAQRGIGLEIMTLEAACRTFNVVMSENRRAVAALIWNDLET